MQNVLENEAQNEEEEHETQPKRRVSLAKEVIAEHVEELDYSHLSEGNDNLEELSHSHTLEEKDNEEHSLD